MTFTPTQEQISRIIELRGQGYTNDQIMADTDIGAGNFTKLLSKFNIPNPQTKRTIELTPQILKLFSDGYNVYNIYKAINLHRSTIVRVLTEHGFDVPKQKTTHHLDQQVIELRSNGVGPSKISEMFDISQSTITYIFQRNNISLDTLQSVNPKPKPTHRICKGCPEKGEQPIENFDTAKQNKTRRNKFVYRTRCKVCLPEYQREVARDRRKRKKPTKQQLLRRSVSKAITKSLKNGGFCKNGASCIEHLPFSMDELVKSFETLFEPWMNWDNYGAYNKKIWNDKVPSTWTWNIDHIIPHSMFIYETMDCQEFRDCWSLSNLRPYNAKQNQHDGASKVRHISTL